MVKYLIFSSEADAQFRNHQIALLQGSGSPDDVTQYWFGCIVHSDGCAALEISDESLITDTEKSELKDEDYMKQNGWIN